LLQITRSSPEEPRLDAILARTGVRGPISSWWKGTKPAICPRWPWRLRMPPHRCRGIPICRLDQRLPLPLTCRCSIPARWREMGRFIRITSDVGDAAQGCKNSGPAPSGSREPFPGWGRFSRRLGQDKRPCHWAGNLCPLGERGPGPPWLPTAGSYTNQPLPTWPSACPS